MKKRYKNMLSQLSYVVNIDDALMIEYSNCHILYKSEQLYLAFNHVVKRMTYQSEISLYENVATL